MKASLKLEPLTQISEVDARQWAALESPDFPFSGYSFLHSLESTQCVGPGTGWLPMHLTLWSGDQLAGALYLYSKKHSYGEFIFDFDWAHAYLQSGREYYPKLVSAVPFTPATGPKLLTRPGMDQNSIQNQLIRAALDLAEASSIPSLHFLYITEAEIPRFEENGFLIRHSTQHHWVNRGYADFEDFLAALKRKRRQQIQKECREVANLPVKMVQLSGAEIEPAHLSVMVKFYQNTFEKKYSYPYLNPEFFFEYHRLDPEAVLLNLTELEGQFIAGAINFKKGKNLYGRYWGAVQETPFVHFQMCYYQNIRYAIAHGLDRFEAGAGGGHKLYRGLSQVRTYSAHWFREPRWHKAIAKYIEEEKRWIAQSMEWSKEHDPYRKTLGK